MNNSFRRTSLGAIALRPRLWRTALRQYRRTVPPRWWAKKPFLPLPSKKYIEFRLQTQYGYDGQPNSKDVLTYLQWCKAQEKASA